jgi:hypothetical protein
MIGNVLLGLFAPVVWGLLSAYVYDRLSQRRVRRAAPRPSAETDTASDDRVR